MSPTPKANTFNWEMVVVVGRGSGSRAGGRSPRFSWGAKLPLESDPFPEFHAIQDNYIHFLFRSNFPGMEERGCWGSPGSVAGPVGREAVCLGPDPY